MLLSDRNQRLRPCAPECPLQTQHEQRCLAVLERLPSQWEFSCRYAKRYSRELERLLAVLERRLESVLYISGPEYSIADIAIWAVWSLAPRGLFHVPAGNYPHTLRWFNTIADRPAVKQGISGHLAMPPEYAQSKATLTPEEWSNVFGDNMHAAVNHR